MSSKALASNSPQKLPESAGTAAVHSQSLSVIRNAEHAVISDSQVTLAGNSVNNVAVNITLNTQHLLTASRSWWSRILEVFWPWSPPSPPPSPPESPRTPTSEGSSSDVEIASLEHLDIARLTLASASLRIPHEVYVRQLYPSGHGYPCSNPKPWHEPVRIGDIGILANGGLNVLENIFDLPESFLQGSTVPTVRTVFDPAVFMEGDTITGGVDNCKIQMNERRTDIQALTFHCNQEEGAILAVTSPAELYMMADSDPLRNYLYQHSSRLFEFLGQRHRVSPASSVYVVTGTILSASWAIATHSKPMAASSNSLVLERVAGEGPRRPFFVWTQRGNAQTRTRGLDAGEKKDQCLFLRGFLLTASPGALKAQKEAVSKVKDDEPSKTAPDSERRLGGTSGTKEATADANSEGRPSGLPLRTKGPHDQTEDAEVPGSVLIHSLPPQSATFEYPSYKINSVLLEKTGAKFAITHDDDWRLHVASIEKEKQQRSTDGPQGHRDYALREFLVNMEHNITVIDDVAFLKPAHPGFGQHVPVVHHHSRERRQASETQTISTNARKNIRKAALPLLPNKHRHIGGRDVKRRPSRSLSPPATRALFRDNSAPQLLTMGWDGVAKTRDRLGGLEGNQGVMMKERELTALKDGTQKPAQPLTSHELDALRVSETRDLYSPSYWEYEL